MTIKPPSTNLHQVVVIGGGFGGLHVVRGLRRAPVEVKLVDKRNFHLFQPLLYQVAGGALSPANIASPLRHIFARQENCQCLLGTVLGIDPEKRLVLMDDDVLPYDTLVVAAGAASSYFGNDHWEEFAPGLKSIEDATKMRARILTAFEKAEVESDPVVRNRLLTFVIVGGGPTGVELAGALADISRRSLRYDFRNINPSDARIILVEHSPRMLMPFPPSLSAKAEKSLERLGVEIRSSTMVTDIQADHVMVKSGDKVERIDAETVLWAAGVQAAPLSRKIAEATGVPLDRGGRFIVEPDFSLPGHPNIFAIGDIASYGHQGEHPLPGVAPAAIQAGQYVAKVIKARVENKTPPRFHYIDKGSLATVGKWIAVAHVGWLKLGGFGAWLLWLVVHLMYITGFRNRILVVVQWAWNFLTNDRSARLITGEAGITDPNALPPMSPPKIDSTLVKESSSSSSSG